ncbi:hypothetical protein [Nitrospira sp. Kam-Ns4a]
MKTLALLLLLLLSLAGCATGLKRDGRCLASLTPEFLGAHQELDELEAAWRAAERVLDRSEAAKEPGPGAGALRPARGSDSFTDAQTSSEEARRAVQEAYRRLVEAKARHRTTLAWYERVYDRVRTRQEEEEILSQARAVLITGPGLLLYPVIHWNVHHVFWDGQDPDAESDGVTQFCQGRLAAELGGGELPGTANRALAKEREADAGAGTTARQEKSGGGTSP